jgi:flagellar biosynthesis GTPase FlhF
VDIGKVNGNLSAKNINGNLSVTSCQGNVSVRDIKGDLMIDTSISGNFTLKEIDGNAEAQARGNVSVELDPSPESSYEFQAKGNLTCRMPDDVSVRVEIERGSKISVKIADVEVPTKISTPYQLVLGDGDARLTIGASGNISLLSRPADWDMGDFEVEVGEDFEVITESLNEQIAAQIEAQMEMMEEELDHQLDSLSFSLEKSAMSADQAERIAKRAREASERANRRAQEKIRRSQEKMQRKLDAAQRRAERKARAAERAARDRRRRPESPVRKRLPSSDPVSEEERLMILQMLEQGNISLEEAEQLLAALEGKS